MDKYAVWGVEKAAEEIFPYADEPADKNDIAFVANWNNQIDLKREGFIAGAKWAGNDAVEFAEWAAKHYAKFAYYKYEKVDNMWFELSDPDNVFTTGQLYNLFKQKQL